MAELGQTTDPKALVPGEPGLLVDDGTTLRRKSADFTAVGDGLGGIRVPAWTGEASDAFWGIFSPEPGKWRTVAGAVDSAVTVILGYTDTLRWAQATAQEAIDLWARGEAVTAEAVAAHNALVDNTNAALASGFPAPAVPEFVDPGAVLRAQAQELLTGARSRLAAAGDNAAAAITGGLAAATRPGSSALDIIVDTVAGGFSGDADAGVAQLDTGAGGSVLKNGKLAEFEAFATTLHASATATFERQVMDGVIVSGQASAEAYHGVKTQGALGPTGLTLTGEAAARVAVAAELRRDFGPVANKLTLEAVAQARAYGEAKAGLNGLAAGAGLESVVTARAEQSVEAYGIEATSGVELHGGAALSAGAGVDLLDDGKVTLSFEADIAAAVGLGVDGSLTVDPAKVGATAVDAADALGGLMTDGPGKIVDFAGAVGGGLESGARTVLPGI